jgi:hypothetical protein
VGGWVGGCTASLEQVQEGGQRWQPWVPQPSQQSPMVGTSTASAAEGQACRWQLHLDGMCTSRE